MTDLLPPGEVEFDCEGCGTHVHAFGRATVPVSHLCAVCEWSCENLGYEEMLRFLEERKARGW